MLVRHWVGTRLLGLTAPFIASTLRMPGGWEGGGEGRGGGKGGKRKSLRVSAALSVAPLVRLQVLKAYDHRMQRPVALKIIRNKKRFHCQGLVEVKILEFLKEHVCRCLLRGCDTHLS